MSLGTLCLRSTKGVLTLDRRLSRRSDVLPFPQRSSWAPALLLVLVIAGPAGAWLLRNELVDQRNAAATMSKPVGAFIQPLTDTTMNEPKTSEIMIGASIMMWRSSGMRPQP